MPSRVIKADLSLVGITAIWGATFVVVKQALADAPPMVFNGARLTIAAVLMAVLFARDLRQLNRRVITGGSIMGLLLAAGYAFQTSGLAYTSPSKSAFITGLSVIIVPFLLTTFFHRPLGWNTTAGALLAVAGLYLLAFAGSGGLSHFGTAHRGELLTLLCAFAFAGHIVATGEYSRRERYRQLAVLQLAFAALCTWLAAPLIGGVQMRVTWGLAGALAVTAVGATALAFTVQAWAQQFTPATHAAIVFSLEPVFAWIVSLLWLHERLRTREAIGAAFTLAAVVLSELAHPAGVDSTAAPSSVVLDAE